jgi:hypothetical protein
MRLEEPRPGDVWRDQSPTERLKAWWRGLRRSDQTPVSCYAHLFAAWAQPPGASSWVAFVVRDGSGYALEHVHCGECFGCPLSFDRTPLVAQSPREAIDAGRAIRDKVVEARRARDGEPWVSDALISEIGDAKHLMDVAKAMRKTLRGDSGLDRIVSRVNLWFFVAGFFAGMGLLGWFLVR